MQYQPFHKTYILSPIHLVCTNSQQSGRNHNIISCTTKCAVALLFNLIKACKENSTEISLILLLFFSLFILFYRRWKWNGMLF